MTTMKDPSDMELYSRRNNPDGWLYGHLVSLVGIVCYHVGRVNHDDAYHYQRICPEDHCNLEDK